MKKNDYLSQGFWGWFLVFIQVFLWIWNRSMGAEDIINKGLNSFTIITYLVSNIFFIVGVLLLINYYKRSKYGKIKIDNSYKFDNSLIDKYNNLSKEDKEFINKFIIEKTKQKKGK